MNASHQHQEFSELLPFYANGTLGEAEREQIEAHLRGCLVCRAELAEEQRLLRAFRATDSTEHLVDDGFDRVMSRVRGSAARPTSNWRRWGQRTLRHVARRGAMVAVLAAVVFGIAQMQGNAGFVKQSFHTLSQDRGAMVGADVVYVAFDAKASMGAINEALAAVHGDVVSGPNRDNVFTVRVPGADVALAVAALKARAEVRFVAGRRTGDLAMNVLIRSAVLLLTLLGAVTASAGDLTSVAATRSERLALVTFVDRSLSRAPTGWPRPIPTPARSITTRRRWGRRASPANSARVTNCRPSASGP